MTVVPRSKRITDDIIQRKFEDAARVYVQEKRILDSRSYSSPSFILMFFILVSSSVATASCSVGSDLGEARQTTCPFFYLIDGLIEFSLKVM